MLSDKHALPQPATSCEEAILFMSVGPDSTAGSSQGVGVWGTTHITAGPTTTTTAQNKPQFVGEAGVTN